jgi:site-specific DNA recombinase
MFRNKSYLGIRKCGDLEVEDAHEPLVDRQTWDAVQSALGTRGGPSDPGKGQPRRETLPFLLTGMARCAECGAAMLGKEDWSGGRKAPFRHYICGRKNREGWGSCPSGKIPAEGPEQAVLKLVAESVLTPELVRAQAALMDLRAPRRERPLRERIEDAQYRLAGVEKSIAVLLDLAEQYGAASAGVRLVEREAERSEVMAELEELEAGQDTEEPIETQDAAQTMLAEMQETLAGADTKAKQALLRRLAVRVTLGKEQGEVICASPSGGLRTLIQYPRGGSA